MALGDSRVHLIGETTYPHEQEGIEYARRGLPNADPYQLWALVELLDPSSGHLYELDLIILGHSALYLVELKGHPGRITGDSVDWWWHSPEGGRRYLEPPLKGVNYKAKILKGLLRRHMSRSNETPRVEGLVFMSAAGLKLDLEPQGRIGVVKRENFTQAITQHDFFGAPSGWHGRRISPTVMRDVTKALRTMGIRKRAGKAHAGSYELRELLGNGEGYQDRVAVHRQHEQIRGRARTYLVPTQSDPERRQRLYRAAERESQLLYDVREHANVLRITDYVTDAPLGPTVIFDPFDDAVPLETFLRQEPDLDFYDRVQLVAQIGRALAHCHKRGVVHGALGPDAVLVRRHPETDALETRLFNFQLGQSSAVEASSHWSALSSDPALLYRAPELAENPRRTHQSDLYSLGALAHLVFTSRPPGDDIVEIYKRLQRDGFLDPQLVLSTPMHDEVADAIREATHRTPATRLDSVEDWVEYFEAAATAPDEVEELDPLAAKKGDLLDKKLHVLGPLGQGASARVLLVENIDDDRRYALKVSLGPDHDERLEREAEGLKSLDHPRIVRWHGTRKLKERTCLLLSVAGSTTLHKLLLKEGTVSLDLAARYGTDLLDALQHLEEVAVVHRDIKPANLGVGAAGKTTKHLTLFDFSLLDVPLGTLNVGTSPYRDPFLPARGHWDPAADRWSAAITLHEMLTGVRPGYSGGAIDPAAKLHLAAERFDASVRPALVRFFECALDRDIDHRHPSAEKMRAAWNACFVEPVTHAAETSALSTSVDEATAGKTPSVPPPDGSLSPPPPPVAPSAEELAKLSPDTPVGRLGLSARAQNALDRAGVLRLRELALLPVNGLTAIRGIGSDVGKEVLALRDAWLDAQKASPLAPEPFFPNYRGADLLLDRTGLGAAVVLPLSDAGIATLGALAASPQEQIAALAKRHALSATALRKRLAAENRAADQLSRPSTLEGWLEAFLGGRGRAVAHVKALFGLAPPFEGRLDVRARDVATHEGCSAPNVYIALGKCRRKWEEHDAFEDLLVLVHSVTDELGGGAPMSDAAKAIEHRLPHDATTTAALSNARAAALIRVVAEVEKDEVDGLRVVRLGGDVPWIVTSQQHGATIRRLAAEADTLAGLKVLLSPKAAMDRFHRLAEGTRLAGLPAERLAQLGARASHHAACSPRGDIYPRDMAPARTLELVHSANVLKAGLDPAKLQQVLQARFPLAAPLPPRPALDELLASFKLQWIEETRTYGRPSEATGTTLATLSSPSSRARISQVSTGHRRRRRDHDAIGRAELEERLKIAVERRALRVLGVRTDHAHAAAVRLSAHLGVPAVPLDRKLIAAMEHCGASKRVSESAVHKADLNGPTGKRWSTLVKLVRDASDEVLAELLPPKEPLLLTNPGLLARYELSHFIEALVRSSAEDDDAHAIFLLVPAHDVGGIPRINARMPIRGVLESDAFWIPSMWIEHLNTPAA